MADTKRRIHVAGKFIHEEYYAGEAGIYPGMLLKINAAGKVIKHTTEGGALGDEILVAVEDALQGKVVADVYAINTIVSVMIPLKGSRFNALVEAVSDCNVADKLMSAGNGTFMLVDDVDSSATVTNVPVIALEDNDLSGSGAVNTLSEVRVA
jgi:hypothetical protein